MAKLDWWKSLTANNGPPLFNLLKVTLKKWFGRKKVPNQQGHRRGLHYCKMSSDANKVMGALALISLSGVSLESLNCDVLKPKLKAMSCKIKLSDSVCKEICESDLLVHDNTGKLLSFLNFSVQNYFAALYFASLRQDSKNVTSVLRYLGLPHLGLKEFILFVLHKLSEKKDDEEDRVKCREILIEWLLADFSEATSLTLCFSMLRTTEDVERLLLKI
jgi:hypothetical protein